MTLSDIIKITNSTVDENSCLKQNIDNMNTLVDATDNELSFFNNTKYQKDLENTKAKAVFIEQQHIKYLPKNTTAIISNNPYLAMAKISYHFYEQKNKKNSDKNIGKNTTIMQGVYIGKNVSIGDNCIIYPNVVIYDNTTIKDNVIIHANSTIGSDGFGYAIDENNLPVKIYHLGYVKIGSFVEIGANNTIDKGVFGATSIDDYCKFDNQVHIGHNCTFGKGTAVTGKCGFAGSTNVGSGVIFYAQSITTGHLSICDKVVISANSCVTKDIKKVGRYTGYPAIEHRLWLKQQVMIKKMSKV